MNVLHEQVRHRQFGIGNITEQTERLITVEFSEEYGIKLFQYPLAFEQYLMFCDAGLQDIIHAKAHLMAEQIEAERKRKEEEYQRQEEERKKKFAAAAPKKRPPAKSSTKKASSKSKKQALPLDDAAEG